MMEVCTSQLIHIGGADFFSIDSKKYCRCVVLRVPVGKNCAAQREKPSLLRNASNVSVEDVPDVPDETMRPPRRSLPPHDRGPHDDPDPFGEYEWVRQYFSVYGVEIHLFLLCLWRNVDYFIVIDLEKVRIAARELWLTIDAQCIS